MKVEEIGLNMLEFKGVVWVANKVGYISGYSLMEQPDQVKVAIDKEPTDIYNWRFDGNKLVRDENNPEKPETDKPKSADEEIAELKENQSVLESTVLELADMILNL